LNAGTHIAVVLAVCALVCNGLSDIVYKRAASAGLPSHRLLQIQSMCYGTIVIAYGLITDTLVFNAASLWGAVAGVFAFTAFFNFARSLQSGNVSVNAPIFRLSFTVTAAMAMLFLGEPAGTLKLVGLGFALVAVWLLLGGGHAGAVRTSGAARTSRASLIRVLVAMLAVAIANLIYKIALSAGATPAGLLTVQAAAVISLANIVHFRAEGNLRPTGKAWRFGIPAAVLLSAAFVLLAESLARGPASTVVPITQMGFIVTAVIGILVMREPVTGRKLTGLAFAIAALAALSQT
jgi:drug/metabolite transporter (DMT)-like permease